jgi:hypothetical protein
MFLEMNAADDIDDLTLEEDFDAEVILAEKQQIEEEAKQQEQGAIYDKDLFAGEELEEDVDFD